MDSWFFSIPLGFAVSPLLRGITLHFSPLTRGDARRAGGIVFKEKVYELFGLNKKTGEKVTFPVKSPLNPPKGDLRNSHDSDAQNNCG
jgi:hypothetical protein